MSHEKMGFLLPAFVSVEAMKIFEWVYVNYNNVHWCTNHFTERSSKPFTNEADERGIGGITWESLIVILCKKFHLMSYMIV